MVRIIKKNPQTYTALFMRGRKTTHKFNAVMGANSKEETARIFGALEVINTHGGFLLLFPFPMMGNDADKIIDLGCMYREFMMFDARFRISDINDSATSPLLPY
jgi:hypothetical protein